MQKLKKLTDDMLVTAYAEGDNKAFDTLLMRHQSRVFSYICSIVKTAISPTISSRRPLSRLSPPSGRAVIPKQANLPSWITRIAHNLIIDFYRQDKSDTTVSSDDETVDILNSKDLTEGNIEDYLVDSQINKDIHRIIGALPESQREVLDMRFFRDMSFKEIAEATGVSINTALGRMRYALINMRRIAAENNIALTR